MLALKTFIVACLMYAQVRMRLLADTLSIFADHLDEIVKELS